MSLPFTKKRTNLKSDPSAYTNSLDPASDDKPQEPPADFTQSVTLEGSDATRNNNNSTRNSSNGHGIRSAATGGNNGINNENRSAGNGTNDIKGRTSAGSITDNNSKNGNHRTNGSRLKVPDEPRIDESKSLLVSDDSLARVQISTQTSPATISHLHAALEHQIAVLLENATLRNSALASDIPSIIGVTSAVKGEGKSTVALHLAISIARDSFKRVCLIDLSLDNDNLARNLNLQESDGIIQVLEGTCNRIPTVEIEGFDNFAVIPGGGGRAPANPAKIARSPQIMEIIAAAREMFDLVIVDLPAVSSGNALPMASQFDAVILVVNAGVTPKQIVNDALDFIGRQRTLGVVLNRTRASMPQWLHRRFSHAR